MGEGARILVVDDDQDMLHLISLRLRAAGYRVSEADSGETALTCFHEERPQLVITDLRMGGMDGFTLFQHLQEAAPTMPVIILTAHGTIPDAVAATRRGVFSFLTKPFDGQELLRRTSDAIHLSPSLDPKDTAQWRKDLISASPQIDELLRQALRIGQEGRSALIIGPDGSGKASLAKAIHSSGERQEEPFVTLSCTEFPADELERRLSPGTRESIYAEAGNGLLYIQDIAALSLIAQARLFSVLFAQMQVRDPLHRLKSTPPLRNTPQTQIIASSPYPLDTAVSDGEFRSDLFYLIGATTLRLPSLSERPEDIAILARYFLEKLRPHSPPTLAPEALSALQEGRWSGNIRQLKNVIEQVLELCLTPVVPEALIRRVMRDFEEEKLPAFDDARRDFERDYLVRLLQTTAGNVAHAARVAQRNRTEFYKLLARHSLDPASFKQKFR